MNEQKDTVMIPYFAHEGEMSRFERINKRQWILSIILIVALIGTNLGWVIYESQFQTETVTETYQATADGNSNAVLNGSGEVTFNGGYSGIHEDDSQAGEVE